MNSDLLGNSHIVLIILTVITSIIGFNNIDFRNRYVFNVSAILGKSKQWDRLLTSASLHGDWLHLFFNMYVLYNFAPALINWIGVWQFFAVYFLSVIGGGLLSLWVHRREYYYTALGASGGVMGVLYAVIAIYPDLSLNLFFIPIDIPAWLFGAAYLAYSVYGMEKQSDNIGHDAHLGGAFVGLVLACVFIPQIITANTLYLGIMLVPLIVVGYFVWKKK